MKIPSVKFLVSIIAVCVVIFGVSYYVSKNKSQLNKVHDLALDKVPPALPADIVLADKSQILHSYTVDQGKTLQSTVIYTSTSTPSKVIAKYSDYLAKNGWQINTTSSIANESINATKGTDRIYIKINQGTVIVNLLTTK